MPARQRTLTATIAWSHDLLDAPEQRLFRRISVFVGGFTLDAAEAVCGDAELGLAVLDGIESLLEKSILGRHDGGARLRLLETVREYAVERASAGGRARRVPPPSCGVLREPRRGGRVRQRRCAVVVAALEAEHNNLRAALSWALEHEPLTALRLGSAIWRFWYARGYLTEGSRWLEEALLKAAGHDAPVDVRAEGADRRGRPRPLPRPVRPCGHAVRTEPRPVPGGRRSGRYCRRPPRVGARSQGGRRFRHGEDHVRGGPAHPRGAGRPLGAQLHAAVPRRGAVDGSGLRAGEPSDRRVAGGGPGDRRRPGRRPSRSPSRAMWRARSATTRPPKPRRPSPLRSTNGTAIGGVWRRRSGRSAWRSRGKAATPTRSPSTNGLSPPSPRSATATSSACASSGWRSARWRPARETRYACSPPTPL